MKWMKMNNLAFFLLLTALTYSWSLPQFFSLNIGFGEDSAPLTFHNQEQQNQDISLHSFQQPSQQIGLQSQRQSVRSQQTFQQPHSSQRDQNFQSGPSFPQKRPSPTLPPTPARSAPAPPLSPKPLRTEQNLNPTSVSPESHEEA